MIFDITDPESPPVLLGELTRTSSDENLAFTTTLPTVVPMKEGNATDWYLILGSGPTDVEGSSTQNAKLGVFKLDDLMNGSAFRIPAAPPTSVSAGSYDLGLSSNGFVSDPITVDYDLEENYRGDVVYFGTIEGAFDSSWGGKLYRLVTNAGSSTTNPGQWDAPAVMLDANRPITAAPTVGTDGENFWVYVGTGRYLDVRDKTDSGSNATQGYYGLKEPIDADGNFTWAEITNTLATNALATPGGRGLLRVDQIRVHEAHLPSLAALSCASGSCLPTLEGNTVANFGQLLDFMDGADGWYRQFDEVRERNLGQAALLGGVLTYTTYQPFDDVCRPEGLSFLYGVYFKTGTGWYEPIFGPDVGVTSDDPPIVIERLSIGRGLSKTPNLHVGAQEGSTVLVQTSTGTIIKIPQPNLPIQKQKTGRVSWRNY
jgi:type IV pilus assembly protein PilY1